MNNLKYTISNSAGDSICIPFMCPSTNFVNKSINIQTLLLAFDLLLKPVCASTITSNKNLTRKLARNSKTNKNQKQLLLKELIK